MVKSTKTVDIPRPRARIVKAASDLFHSKGVRGVSLDAIASRAKTTKMAIYRHFASKDALIVEWLSNLTDEYLGLFDALADKYPHDPAAQLTGLVKFVADSLDTWSHRGCPFVNSIAELPSKNHPARRLIERHKTRQAARLKALCTSAKIPQPELAAAEISFLLEGAQVAAQNKGIRDAKLKLIALVETILARAEPAAKRRINGSHRSVADAR
jgi:AcrR family transcriptional regulator